LNITGVPWQKVERLWPFVEPLIQKALDRTLGEYLSGDIYGFLINQEMQLWIAGEEGIDAAMVTQIVTYPRKKFCNVVLVGGSGLKDWLKFQPILLAWAKEHGCNAVRSTGRRGWHRVLGWTEAYTVSTKEL
jgi:hypothetical protein